jgi:hypothetical protein
MRELENCVQHMVAVNERPLLHLRDMPLTVLGQTQIAASPLLGLWQQPARVFRRSNSTNGPMPTVVPSCRCRNWSAARSCAPPSNARRPYRRGYAAADRDAQRCIAS